jgi:hypothetical protein
MKPFRVLLQWIQRRRGVCVSNASTRLGGNDFDWSVSLSNFPSSCNMMLRLSSPVLSMIESYLGSRDKLNLRLTCKLLYAELPQHELPLYRPHFMPTSTLQSSFVSATDQVVPSPLFLERFGASKVVENAKLLRSSHSIARACMSCNHHLPHSAITLPTLVHCGVDQPILKMSDDHKCFILFQQLIRESRWGSHTSTRSILYLQSTSYSLTARMNTPPPYSYAAP